MLYNQWLARILQRYFTPDYIRSYFFSRNCLSVNDGVLMYLDRVVIPPPLRKDIRGKLHIGQKDIIKSKELAAWFLVDAD